MTAIFAFTASENSFTGTLPDSSLEAMRGMRFLLVSNNRFAGALPNNGFRELTGLEVMQAEYNDFEGKQSQTRHGYFVWLLDTHHPLFDLIFFI
eukprot:1237495-Amphidinium_carterae.1